MKIVVVILALLIETLSLDSIGQVATKNNDQNRMEEAEELIKNAAYNQAIEIYLDILENDNENNAVKLKLADVYYSLHSYKESLQWYESVLKKPFDTANPAEPNNFYNYAELLLMNERVEEAVYWYELYANRQPDDQRAARKIEGIRKIPELKNMHSRYQIEEVSFNSRFNDFAPAFYGDGLVFVSDRHELADDKTLEYFDLYFCASNSGGSFMKPTKLSENINTTLNEGPASFYNNDQKVVFTRNVTNKLKNSEERVILHLQLFYSEKDSLKGTWKIPVPLSINNKNYSMGHPSLSGDGKYLYFSSTIPEGFGGTDIYVSEWVDGNWTSPKNLGRGINTEGNEMFPFIYQDSLLYFSSDGHGGLGGLDNYRVNLNTNQLENFGYLVNSSKDDFGLIVKGDIGYFSSNRQESKSGKNDDIYKVIFLPETPPQEILPPEDSTVFIEIVYTVQILALKNSEVVNRKFLQDLKGVVKHDGKDGFHRYTYGSYKTQEEAVRVLEEVKLKGYNDAFIRREALYTELSKRGGIEVEKLYK